MLTKNTIESFPWEELATKGGVLPFIEAHQLKAKPWFLEQLLSRISRWPLVRTEDGKIDGEATVKNAVRASKLNQGMYFLVIHPKRGDYVDRQNSTGAPYSALVPLILAAHKKYNGIKYSDWGNTRYCLDPMLEEATQPEHYELYKSLCDLGSETLLSILEHGLVFRGGAKQGESRSARSTYNLYDLKNVDYGPNVLELPHLARVMLLQFWLAHPTVRNQYMILNPLDWDVMPATLIPELNISGTNKSTKKDETYTDGLPWEV